MFCIFSLDLNDEAVKSSGLRGQTSGDLVVCPWCPMYLQAYSVITRDEEQVVLWNGTPEGPLAQPVLPYPRRAVRLELDELDLDSGDVVSALEKRKVWNGVYHMLTPVPLWGTLAQHAPKQCPVCGSHLEGVAVIDSDSSLGLQQRFTEQVVGRVSLNWVDDFYLFVRGCSACQLLSYAPVHG